MLKDCYKYSKANIPMQAIPDQQTMSSVGISETSGSIIEGDFTGL
jgi:hypothetical protein